MISPNFGTHYFGQTQASPAIAISSPTNTALGVSGGTMGGQGMGLPAGATAAPAGGVGAGLAGAAGGVDALSKALQSYVGAVPQAPEAFTPRLANFDYQPLGPRKVPTA